MQSGIFLLKQKSARWWTARHISGQKMVSNPRISTCVKHTYTSFYESSSTHISKMSYIYQACDRYKERFKAIDGLNMFFLLCIQLLTKGGIYYNITYYFSNIQFVKCRCNEEVTYITQFISRLKRLSHIMFLEKVLDIVNPILIYT